MNELPTAINPPKDLEQLLKNPIAWRSWTQEPELQALLTDLQANILKGHGRDHTANIFISFDGMRSSEIGRLLVKLSFATTSALEQLRAAATFREAGVSGGRVVCLFLAASAYNKLGATKIPPDEAFRAGMEKRGGAATLSFPLIGEFSGLNDPPRSQWETGGAWSPDGALPDAMLLVADDDASLVHTAKTAFVATIVDAGAQVLGIDIGLAQRRLQPGSSPKGEGLEHFGYVDGRSQPLFLTEDLENRQQLWDEAFSPSQFIVADPSGATAFSCGSYFVYRKLEQNVEAFKRRERQLAGWLGLTGDDAERAGALVVGRFENGTPVVLSAAPRDEAPTNDFNYDTDTAIESMKCPFRGHIRKTNPRTAGDEFERGRIMARRGITYGERAPRQVGADFLESDRPSGGVGLIFMAYMKDINGQFEFTQAAWAGNPDFKHDETGIDPVIGQRPNRPDTKDIHWVDGHSVTKKTPALEADYDFKTAVRLVGGEYFFAPSISFLQSLGS